MTTARPFTVSAFRRAWNDPRLTQRQIGVMFGCCARQVAARARMLDLPEPRPLWRSMLPPDELRRMHGLGMSYAAIAGALGCHYNTVMIAVRRLGLPSRGNGRRSSMSAERYLALVEAGEDPAVILRSREARDRLLARMVEANVARADIARVVGCHKSSVTRRARALGLPPRVSGGERRTTLAEFRQMLIEDRLATGMRRAS